MRHAVAQGHPYLGAVVLDSPLKAYAQKESPDDNDRDIPTATVNQSFYRWLSRWNGPGQVENEAVDPAVAKVLNAIEFTDSHTHGRQGISLYRAGLPTSQSSALPNLNGIDDFLG